MEVVFTGTGGGIPNKFRQNSGMVLKNEGQKGLILFDCAEGTQIQMIQYLPKRFQPEKVDTILISHLHLDHIGGIAPFIRTLAMHGRKKELVIIGPDGLKEIVLRNLVDYIDHFKFTIKFYKIHVDGLIEEDLKLERHGFIIKCRRLSHGRTLSLVYILEETSSRPKDVHLLFGDCTYGEEHSEIIKVYKDRVNFMLHECTLENSLKEKPQSLGHSTPEDVVDLCKKLGPKNPFVNHFSARYHPVGAKNKWNLGTIKQELELEGYPIEMAEELKIYPIN